MNPDNEQFERPSYYSIIPATVRYDKRLKFAERLMFSEITALSNKYGYCTASNGYFAALYEVDKTTISRWINHLKSLGYLRTEMLKKGRAIASRRIYLNMDPTVTVSHNTPIDPNALPIDRNTPPIDPTAKNLLNEMPSTYTQNDQLDRNAKGFLANGSTTSWQNDQAPIDRNAKDNNTRENNTSLNTTSIINSNYATQSEYIQRGTTATSRTAADDAGRQNTTGQSLANAGATAPVAQYQQTVGQATQQRGRMMPADPAGPNSLNDPNGLNVVFNAWADLWDWPSKAAIADLSQWVQEFGKDVVLHAIKKAATADAKRPLGYISAIMRDYHKAGYQSLADVQAADEARDAQKQQAQTQNYRGGQYNRGGRANVQETLPSWAEPEFVADGNQPSAETLQVEKDRAETAENQLNRAVKFHQQLFYGDLETIRKNLSKPDGHGYMSVDAPKLFEQYLAQQGQGA